MRSIRPLSMIIGAAAVLAVAYLAVDVAGKLGPSHATVERRSAPVDVFRMDGVSYTAQDADGIRFRFTADRLEVAKRQFGVLYVTPLKEAVLSNVELELYPRERAEPAQEALSLTMLAELVPADQFKDLGIITRVRIDGLTIRVVRGDAVSAVTARRAILDPRSGVTELSGGVHVAAADGRSIRSEASTWDQQAGVFSINGPYLLVQPGKVMQGSGVRFDAELRGVRS